MVNSLYSNFEGDKANKVPTNGTKEKFQYLFKDNSPQESWGVTSCKCRKGFIPKTYLQGLYIHILSLWHFAWSSIFLNPLILLILTCFGIWSHMLTMNGLRDLVVLSILNHFLEPTWVWTNCRTYVNCGITSSVGNFLFLLAIMGIG